MPIINPEDFYYYQTLTPILQSRWAPKFNEVDQYGDTGSLNYSGDFWIKVSTKLPVSVETSNQAVFGGVGGSSPSAGAFALFLQPDNVLSLQLPTSSGVKYDISFDITTKLGRFINIELKRDSGVLTLIIDGTVVDTFDSNPFGVVDVEVANIGRWGTTSYYSGIIYNYSDSLGNMYPMDDRTFGAGAVMRNSATILGDELIPNKNLSHFSGISGVSKSDTSYTTTNTFSGVYYDVTGLVIGNTYLIDISFGDVTVGSDRIYLYESNEFGTIQKSSVIPSNSSIELVFTALSPSQRLYLRRNLAGTDVVNYVSLRQADNNGTYINATNTMWQEISV